MYVFSVLFAWSLMKLQLDKHTFILLSQTHTLVNYSTLHQLVGVETNPIPVLVQTRTACEITPPCNRSGPRPPQTPP